MMQVDIKDIVRNIGKNIEFLQPAYEAISNSLEANATQISIEFFQDNQTLIAGCSSKIAYYSITDNGDGFTDKNICEFNKLWTSHKLDMGCKGSGRFTWLNVFDNIKIKSELASSKKIIDFDFNLLYNADKTINPKTDLTIINNKTTITFNNVSEKMFKIQKGGKARDLRDIYDIEHVYKKIFNYFLIKLFLLKRELKDFEITIKLGNNMKTISHEQIPELRETEFKLKTSIQSDCYGDEVSFNLYYRFTKDKAKSKKAHYCAAGKTVKDIDDDGLGFSASLPGGDSFIVLLCSKYFDDNVNEARNGFNGIENENLKSRNTSFPLFLTEIKTQLKKEINKIILNEYPDIVSENFKIKEKAMAITPYLSKYIKQNSDILITEDSLIKEAKKDFTIAKEQVHIKYETLMKDAELNIDALSDSVREVTEIGTFELGEYIQYREKIIKALDKAISDISKKEDFIHNIFIPKGTKSSSKDDDKQYLSNLWLFDDKYMTYSTATSDKTVKSIVNAIAEKNSTFYGDSREPDIALFFNKEDEKRDAIIFELKGLNATRQEKARSLTELPENIVIIKENLPEITTIWGYIITDIDNDFSFSINSQSGYQPIFVIGQPPAYYRYFDKQKAHIYIIDIKTIIADSTARNKTFLDILTKK